jgi:hypothetical protein
MRFSFVYQIHAARRGCDGMNRISGAVNAGSFGDEPTLP